MIEAAVLLGELLPRDEPLSDTLAAFTTRRYDRCCMVRENSLQIAEWQKHPDAPAADTAVCLMYESQEILARPF